MFCNSCGAECSSSAKFCGKCGHQINEAVEQTSKKVDEGGALTFKQFKTRKEEDRKGYFRNKRPAKKAKLAHQPDSEVKINIGIMVLRDGGLIAKRGITLPLTVTESIGAEELLEKAVVKHHRFNKDVVRSSSKVFYHLLYGDKNLVNTLPGSDEPFTLKRYKAEIEKPYSRITLYLCSSSDYNDSVLMDLNADLDEDSDSSTTTAGFTPSSGVEGSPSGQEPPSQHQNQLAQVNQFSDFNQSAQSDQLAQLLHSSQSSQSAQSDQQAQLLYSAQSSQFSDSNQSAQSDQPAHLPYSVQSNQYEQSNRSAQATQQSNLVLSQQGEDEDLISMLYDDNAPKKEVIVHRSTIRKDMIEIFSDQNISGCLIDVIVIDARGQQEEGRGRGVLLDILTEFWQNVFTSLTVGSGEKIPFIRHDLQKPEWEAIARILVYGYKTVKYFPISLSHLFLASCLFGEESITPDFLLTSFREYIAAEDRDVLDACLSDAFDPNDKDALDFLSTYKCFRVPRKDNIQKIIIELAHQELIQKPRYVLNSWAPIVNSLRSDYHFQTLEGLKGLYDIKCPTAKKIIKLFRAEPSNDAERQSLEHLKRFVKSLEGKALTKFLQFCTGSDVITTDAIEVSFSSLEGLQRRPVARTCVPLLELPTTYESYPALVEEFTNVMNEAQAWSFDIV